MNDERKMKFSHIEALRDYTGFTRADIIDAGLDMIIANDQLPKDPKEKVDFFMNNDEIMRYIKDNSSNRELESKIKYWVSAYNELNQIEST